MKMNVCTRCHKVLPKRNDGGIKGRLKKSDPCDGTWMYSWKIDWCNSCAWLFEAWLKGGRNE